MNKSTTKGIILRRVNFSEADRIVTVLTPKSGKISAIAKGVRREKSKLAGGLELLSVSDIGYISGKGNLDQIVSSRIVQHFDKIVSDYDRVQLAYKTIELIEKITEDDAGEEYYDYLLDALEQLNDTKSPLSLVELWSRLEILQITGYLPNLQHDCRGKVLKADQKYQFNSDDGCFTATPDGLYTSEHIKLWRLATASTPQQLRKITGAEKLSEDSLDHLRVLMANVFHVE